jgi:hypothetical protein
MTMANRLITTIHAWLAVSLFAPTAGADEGGGAVPPRRGIGLDQPVPESRSANPFPGFSWSAHPDASKEVGEPVEYQIQIASGAGFTTLIDEDRVALNRYVCDKPFNPGNYQWRVRAIPYRGEPTNWTAPSSFIIREPEVVLMVDTAKDVVEAVREAVAKARAAAGRSVRIVVPPGDYKINESFKGPLFEVSGLSNTVIDGAGVRLRFSNRKQGLIKAKDSANIAIMGFDTSFAKGSLRVQGRVKAVDTPNRTVTVAIEPGYPGFDASDNPKHDIFYLLEPGTEGRLKTGAPNFFRADGAFKREAEGLWSFTISRDTGFCQVGDRFGFNFRAGSSHLVDFSQSRSMTAYRLTHAGWGGMQFVSIEGSDFRILHCKTRFAEGDWMTGNADGVHIRGHVLGPWIEGVRIQAIGDDSIALYARPAWMKSVDSGGNPRVALCRSEFFNLETGDEISFFQPLKGEILLETRVEHVARSENGFKVTFADPLPRDLRFEGPVQQATQIWNRSKSCGDFMVRKCEFINIRRYGTVFRSKRGVVEENAYRGISARAIVFTNETEWPNGLYSSEIIVRNNTIIDSCFDNPNGPAAISFLFNGYRRGAGSIGPRNLLIEGNWIESCPSPEITLKWVHNAVVRGNTARIGNSPRPARVDSRQSERIVHSDGSAAGHRNAGP